MAKFCFVFTLVILHGIASSVRGFCMPVCDEVSGSRGQTVTLSCTTKDNSSLRGWMRKGLKAKPLNENEKYHMINEKTSTGEYRYLLTINNLNDDDFGLYVVYLSGCNGGLVTLEMSSENVAEEKCDVNCDRYTTVSLGASVTIRCTGKVDGLITWRKKEGNSGYVLQSGDKYFITQGQAGERYEYLLTITNVEEEDYADYIIDLATRRRDQPCGFQLVTLKKPDLNGSPFRRH